MSTDVNADNSRPAPQDAQPQPINPRLIRALQECARLSRIRRRIQAAQLQEIRKCVG